MKMEFTVSQKIFFAVAFIVIAVIGFMVKLPSGFRHIDKELHALFYFLAAAVLNFLFAGTKILLHVIVFISLYLFGVGIEFGQQYSNRFFRNRIHGRFDAEDLQWNLKGLIAFTIVWLLYTVITSVYRRNAVKEKRYKSELH